MKLLLASAAVLGAATFASVPTTLVVMANDDAAQETLLATEPVTESETDEVEEPEVVEPDVTDDPTVEPSETPTRGWQVEHPNNGNHFGWETGHHAYGAAVRAWALCVSTQGKENCGDKPTPPGQDKTTAPEPTEEPTPGDEPTITAPEAHGNGQGQGNGNGNGPKPK
jgi:hypothetical protein